MCQDALNAYLITDESKCLANEERALFKMQLNDQNINQAPNKITLESCKISNMFYAINSIIGFTPIQGKVILSNSQFTQLQICGSIIKNYYNESGKPDIRGSINYLLLNENQNQDVVRQINFSSTPKDYNYNPKNKTCTGDCFGIQIINCNFSNIPFLSNGLSKYQLVSQSNGMQRQGLIVSLSYFNGPVIIQNSNFNSNQVPFFTCDPEVPQVRGSLNNFQQLLNSNSSFDKIQKQSLINIQNHTGTITIQNNNFTNNVMTSGLIIIDSFTKDQILITKNSFIQNSAIRDYGVINLRKCSNLIVTSNNFLNNAGCSKTGIVKLQCQLNNYNYDTFFDEYTLVDGTQSKSNTDITMNQNVFNGNLVGKDKNIVTVEGFALVNLQFEKYIQNENYLPQLFKLLSPLYNIIQQTGNGQDFNNLNTINGYLNKAQSILRVAASSNNTVNLKNMTFQNNWIADCQSIQSDYQSNGILLQDFTGFLYLSGLTFNRNIGVQGSTRVQIRDQGMRSGLIVFKNVIITGINFESVTFSQNSLYYSLAQNDASVVNPTLFSLLNSQITQQKQVLFQDVNILSTSITNASCAVYLNLKSFKINQFAITSNSAPSALLIEMPTDLNSDNIVLKNGLVNLNTVSQHGVIWIREARNIIFSGSDKQRNSASDQNPKITIQQVNFTQNQAINQALTSAVEIQQTQYTRKFSWLSIILLNSQFYSNTGLKTDSIYYSDNMVSLMTIQSCFFYLQPLSSSNSSAKEAQIIYKDDAKSYLNVSSSTFQCGGNAQIYDKKIIMQYSEKAVYGRPSLFKIYDSTPQQPLQNLDIFNTQNNGTLESKFFKNQFYQNSFISCNQFNKGTVYYLKSGAKLYDYQSQYQQLSALQGGIGYITGDGSYLQIENALTMLNIYAYYGALSYVDDGASVHFQNSITIQKCNSYEGTLAYLNFRGRLLMLYQIEVTSNNVNQAGLIAVYNGGQFWLDGVTFSYNTAELCCVIINIQNGREQYHLTDGSIQVPYDYNQTKTSFILNCVITQNQINLEGRLISVFQASLYVNNTNFYSQYQINIDNYGIVIEDGELQILNSKFTGNQGKNFYNTFYQRDLQEINGAFIASYGTSHINVNNCQFSYGRATQGGCIALYGSIQAVIMSSTFDMCYAMFGGAIYANAFQTLQVYNSNFTNNFAYQGYGQNIYGTGGQGKFLIDSCILESSVNSIFISSILISIQSTFFTGVPNKIQQNDYSNGGGLYIDWGLIIDVKNCTFEKLKSLNGGAIYFREQSNNTISNLDSTYSRKDDYSFTITDTKFRNCLAIQNGGSLYFQDIRNGSIKGTSSIDNSFAHQNGGGLYFWCQPVQIAQQIKGNGPKCALYLDSLTFNYCKAEDSGGGIFWNFIEPQMGQPEDFSNFQQTQDNQFQFKTVTFNNCNATNYGKQIAGVAQELIQVPNVTYQEYYHQNILTNPKRQLIVPLSSRITASYGQFLSYFTYQGVQSGGFIPDSWFLLIDKYNQVVQTNQGQQIQFSLVTDTNIPNEQFSNYITGMKDFYSMYGCFQTGKMGIISAPGINLTVSLIVNAIDINVPSVNSYLAQQFKKPILDQSDYNISVQLQVRDCILGEGLTQSGSCFTCPVNSYLLTIPKVPTQCAVCQADQSICLGGANIGPQPNWWRKSALTYKFIPCKIDGPCLGINVDLPMDLYGNKEGLCDLVHGYYGVICSACLPGFKRSNTYGCSKCSQYEPYFTAIAFVGLTTGLCILIKSTIDDAASKNNTHSVFTKILLNHMQMLLITSSFDMNWPSEVLTIFQIAAPIRELTSLFTQFDCYMDRRDPKSIDPYNFYADPNEFRVVYQKLLIMAGLPIFLAVCSYLTWYFILKYQKKIDELQPRFIASLIMLLFLVHPSISQTMINMFNCQDYDNDFRLAVDLQVICFKGMHTYFAWGVALPCLLLWGIGIPAIVLVMMRKDSEKLNTEAVKQKFGFLYNGYKPNTYYWEIVIMYRKIICIFIAVMLNKVGIIVQALVLLILLCVFLQANASNRPFSERSLNDIESFSLATQIVTIYCGVFFISAKNAGSPSFDVNKDFSLDNTGTYIFFVVIAFCNIAFLILWMVKFVTVIRVLIKEKYPNVYIVLFLCGRADKMALETAKRARDTKKEAIIESIEAVNLMMSKMKAMYINNTFYQDHNRFLNLLYYIESERQQIDLTEKRHNYYIQGSMARHRKFDPEIVKEAQDLRFINDQENFLVNPKTLSRAQTGVSKKPSFRPNTAISKVGILPTIEDDKSEAASRISPDKSYIFSKQQSIQEEEIFDQQHESGLNLISQLNESVRQKQKKPKEQRKPNMANLTTNYLNTRNQVKALKTEKVNHIRVADVSVLDGSVILPELPEYLRGFKDIYKVEEQKLNKQETKLNSIGSEDRLQIVRKLTDRMDRQLSPQKSIKSAKTQISGSKSQIGDTAVVTQTQIDGESEKVTVKSETSVKPFQNNEGEQLRNNEEEKSQIGVLTSWTTKGGGGQFEKNEKIESDLNYARMRAPKGLERKLEGDKIVLINNAAQPLDIVESDLTISIFDEDGNFVENSKTAVQIKSQLDSNLNKNVISKENVDDQDDITESFRTDQSMQDFDIMQDEEVKNQVSANDIINKNKQSKENSQSRFSNINNIGEGLNAGNAPNFYPTITPGILFDNSKSILREDEEDDEAAQDSRRNLLPGKLEFMNLTDKSRN